LHTVREDVSGEEADVEGGWIDKDLREVGGRGGGGGGRSTLISSAPIWDVE
jgi:hypothetical protein